MILIISVFEFYQKCMWLNAMSNSWQYKNLILFSVTDLKPHQSNGTCCECLDGPLVNEESAYWVSFDYKLGAYIASLIDYCDCYYRIKTVKEKRKYYASAQ